jgi:hypothetical protein
MKFKKLNGFNTYKNISNYRIDWEGKSLSNFQKKVKQFFKKFWANDVCYEEMPLAGTRLRLDIFNASRHIGVEIHGSQHGKFNPFFHGNDRNKFLDQIHRDLKKTEWCEINGFLLIEIFAEEEKILDKDPKEFKRMIEEKYKIKLIEVI